MTFNYLYIRWSASVIPFQLIIEDATPCHMTFVTVHAKINLVRALLPSFAEFSGDVGGEAETSML